jgi:hypothetical protein
VGAGNPDEARKHMLAACDLLETITRADSSNAEFQKDLKECRAMLNVFKVDDARQPTTIATPAKP